MADSAEALAGVDDVDLSGDTVLITGSTAGIGREVACALARLGASVLVHGRDRDRGRAVVERIDDAGGDAELFVADFASQEAVRGLAGAVRELAPVDVVVNNAGGLFRRPRATPEGFEHTFAVNHLAPFLLTTRLRRAGHLADDGRVVTTASRAHRDADGIDFDAVRAVDVDGYSPWRAYARSKLANVLFAAELARRSDDVTSNCFHPGFVPGSSFLRELPLPVRTGLRAIEYLPDVVSDRLATSVVDGAAGAVYLAAAPAVADVSGGYFVNGAPTPPSPVARDTRLRKRLWEQSVEWTGLDAGCPT